jgi:RES domain-containing protein
MIAVYRISHCKYIDDLSGTGAALNGGRWNSEGTYILYTSSNASLALLETLVHFNGMQKSCEFCRLKILIPEENIFECTPDILPAGWDEFPPPLALQQTGDRFINDKKYFALKIPSAIEPEEWNYLLNPAHPLFKKIKIAERKLLTIDKRLMKFALL